MTTVLPVLIGTGFPATAVLLCAMATLGVARRKVPDALKVIESLFTAVLFVVIARQFGGWQYLGSVGWCVLVASLAVATAASVLALWRLPLAQPDLSRSALVGRWVNAALACVLAVGAAVVML
ncbi:MAG: hypothetical protein ACTHWA_08590 [Arachnia sp.]